VSAGPLESIDLKIGANCGAQIYVWEMICRFFKLIILRLTNVLFRNLPQIPDPWDTQTDVNAHDNDGTTALYCAG